MTPTWHPRHGSTITRLVCRLFPGLHGRREVGHVFSEQGVGRVCCWHCLFCGGRTRSEEEPRRRGAA